MELGTQAEELGKARAEVAHLEGELARSRDATAEVPELRAQLEATQDQARTTRALAVSMFLASEEMTKVKYSTFNSLVRLSPAISTSYSTSLLEALNLNIRAQCIRCPSGLTSIRPAPDPPLLEDLFIYKPYLGIFVVGIVGASSGRFSSRVVNSAMKSASAYPLIAS